MLPSVRRLSDSIQPVGCVLEVVVFLERRSQGDRADGSQVSCLVSEAVESVNIAILVDDL